jgi:hypothetical protein
VLFLYKNGDSNINFLSLIFKSRDKPKDVDKISPASFLFVHLSQLNEQMRVKQKIG